MVNSISTELTNDIAEKDVPLIDLKDIVKVYQSKNTEVSFYRSTVATVG